jgi:biotin carboxyl carrier protein
MARVEVECEVQGTVWKVLVAEGDRVGAGDVLLILESMKMEIPLESPVAGLVTALRVAPDQAVAEGDIVVLIDT